MCQQRLGYGDLHKKNSPEVHGMLPSMAGCLTLAQLELKCVLARLQFSGGYSPDSVCRASLSPKPYCASSSQPVAQHHKCRIYQREEELHLNHGGCAQTELEPSGLQWRTGGGIVCLVFLLSLRA